MSRREQTEVIVVGSGAGGAPVAAVLAEAGLRVVVLERGPWYTIDDFGHDEVKSCRRDFWIPFAQDDPHTLREAGQERAQPSREGWTSRNVGGATVHMGGFFYRLQPEDFRLRTLTGGVEGSTLADWPLGLADLEPYYDEMEVRLGVSGDAAANPRERHARPYPLPPLAAHPAARLIDEAAASLGWRAFPTPRAVLSRAYGRRPPCNQCGYCGDYGCENHSKSSALSTFLPDALATGRCELRAGATVSRILVDEGGPRPKVRGVEYLDRDGGLHRLEAPRVVLAASAIESARLLLLSRTPAFPEGLANGSGLVGRNLTFSTFAKVTGLFERAALVDRLGPEGMDLPFLQRSIQDDYFDAELGKGGTYNLILQHPNPINAAVRLTAMEDYGLWGAALKERLARYFREELWMEAEVFGEFLPTEACRVDLDPRVKDRFGLPVARITHHLHPTCREQSARMAGRAGRLFEAVTPAPLRTVLAGRGSTTFHLQHGTCRFGDDPASSVLDRDCRAHEVGGLHVTDGSFMPTSGGVPATATIMANALRVAHGMARDRG
ncbi:MAG: GMC family oxidoreductase [Deltaproteobacteria bacterium]|nr:GMC family oxidoreductase [Deltaproteobacteria bacterium]